MDFSRWKNPYTSESKTRKNEILKGKSKRSTNITIILRDYDVQEMYI